MIPAWHRAPSPAEIDWHTFLDRPRLPPPPATSLIPLRDASILVTGAAGSIGSALSLRLAALRPRALVLVDASEHALHRLQTAFAGAPVPAQPRLVLANVEDSAHLSDIFEEFAPELVLHAAAHKHVPLLEEHPLKAMANNALGTWSVARCARDCGAARLVLVSTDKAVAPVSILGATKRVAERVVLAQNGVVLRLGNVLGTEGSVSETFLRQIAAGSPITVTDAQAERYFLTREEAVDLLLSAATTAPGGSLLAPHLDRQHSIVALARFLASPTAQNLRFTGLRPGDKLREALWSSDERPGPSDVPGCLAIRHALCDASSLYRDLARLQAAVDDRDLARALEALLRIVPDYAPGATVLALAQRARASAQGAAQR